MITITRLLARQVGAMFRRVGIGKRPTIRTDCKILFQAGAEGLVLRAKSTETAIEYHEPGDLAPARAVLPLEFFQRCQGSKHEPVTIEVDSSGKVVARWTDGIPQMVDYLGEEEFPAFPPLPEDMRENEPKLLRALADASKAAALEPTRFALSHLQLAGDGGKIVGTDGSQILSQRGFRFPWAGEVLLPAAPVLRCKELPQDQPVFVGAIDKWIALRTGPWTFWFVQPVEARFPKVDAFDQAPAFPQGRLRLSPADAQFLITALPRLPENDDFNDPLTLDLDSEVVVRARGKGQIQCTELLPRNSQYEGEPVRVNSNRKFLIRALELGFREFCVNGAESPIVAAEEDRTYTWAVLDAKSALRASPDPIRIESPDEAAVKRRVPRLKRFKQPMPAQRIPTTETAEPETHAAPTVAAGTQNEPPTPLEHAIELRATLRLAVVRTGDLVAALKQQRRKSRLVEATLRGLKSFEAA